jgi:diaminopimelate epimerase
VKEKDINMKFTKMQGCGNDYVYVNCFKEKIVNEAEVAIKVSDRHFGIGSDGMILIKPSDKADFTMVMYNADGSRSAMCGNGIRCVGKYVYDYGLTNKQNISIETAAGIKYLDLKIKDNKVEEVTVNMGSPIIEPEKIPVKIDQDKVIAMPITVAGNSYEMTCVSMGNPHAVVFVEDTKSINIEYIGPLFENHELFPERTNTEFIHVVDSNTIEMRVWERGSGETLACGTGACASVYACILNGFTSDTVLVKLLGGELKIHYDRDKNTIFMTGPAVTVFEGDIVL